MSDKERISRIAAMLSSRKDGKDIVNGFKCGGKKFGDGGKKRLSRLISRMAEKNTNGLISADDVDTILEHPTDYMKYLYSEDELNEMRRRLYSEYYPMGYFGREGIPAASDIMQGKESKGEADMLRSTMAGAITRNGNGSEKFRDSYFAEWLGIPEEERRYPGFLVPSPYYPSVGNLDDLPIYKIADNAFPDKNKQIIDAYIAASQLADNEFVPKNIRPEKGKAGNYVVDPSTFLLKDNAPKTKKEWRKFWNSPAGAWWNTQASELFANGLAAFTVGSGVDPQRGQYISMFDKWDVNPFDSRVDIQGGLMEKLAKAAGIPQNFDATGGVGRPFYIYDRVYLDDYYGVDSRPQNPDEFYGGYLVPSVVSAEKSSGGRLFGPGGKKNEEREKFQARDNTRVSSVVPQDLGYVPAEERPLPEGLGKSRWDDGPMGFLPIVGDALQGFQAYDDFQNHDWATGLQTAGLLIVPNVAEKAVRGLVRESTLLDNVHASPKPDYKDWYYEDGTLKLDLEDAEKYAGMSPIERDMQIAREAQDAKDVVAGERQHFGTLSGSEAGTKKQIPEGIREELVNGTRDRMIAMRPEWSPEEVEAFKTKFDAALDKPFYEYPNSTLRKAGWGDRVAGRQRGDTGHLAVREGKTGVVGHEYRHNIEDKVEPLNDAENAILENAYGDDFYNSGHPNYTPEQLKNEMYTTNKDARDKLISDMGYDLGLPLDEQNAIIDLATPDQIARAVWYSNGYGQSFGRRAKAEGRWTYERMEKIREAMKKVGAVAGIGFLGSQLLGSESEEEPNSMALGGKLYGSGGKFFRTSVPESDDSVLYQVPERTGYYDIEPPARWMPEPNYGDYEPPKYDAGALVNYPIPMGYPAPQPGHGVLVSEEQPVVYSAPAIDPIKDAARRIMAVENSKANANGGWDAKTGRWYPHKSVEGGADTIAYGIKLSNGTPEAALALKQGYLTDEQAASAVDTLARKYYDAAKRVYDKKYGEGEWDKLSDKSQSILVDYSYNPGLAKFPSLMEGFHSGNMDLIRKNYKRYVNGKELGRNKVLLEEIDTLDNEYPIFRAKGGKIHIKPENRGKFTALLKRTGKSASWFKAHGTPAQKKMAVFALNAKKWKHGDGGPLDRYGDDAVRAALAKLRNKS